MVAENGMEPAEECKNPPKHLPQAAGRAGTHMRPNRAALSREMARCRFAAVVGSLALFPLNDSPGVSTLVSPCTIIW